MSNAGYSRGDGTIKSPARKCRVGEGKASSPERDGTGLHSPNQPPRWLDTDPQRDLQSPLTLSTTCLIRPDIATARIPQHQLIFQLDMLRLGFVPASMAIDELIKQ